MQAQELRRINSMWHYLRVVCDLGRKNDNSIYKTEMQSSEYLNMVFGILEFLKMLPANEIVT